LFVLTFNYKGYAQYFDTVCVNENNVRYKVNETLGSSYNWQITGGSIIAGQGTSNIIVNWGSLAGVFNLSVTETNGASCAGQMVTDSILIQSKPQVVIIGPDLVCADSLIAVQASGSLNYIWNNGSNGNAIVEKIKNTKTYYVIGENNGCRSDTVFKTVTVISKPNANFTANQIKDWIIGDEIQFTATDLTINKWVWDINNIPMNQNQPTINFILNMIGLNTIKLTAYNSFNCSDTFSITNNVVNKLDLYIPSAFSPNNDNLNDIFEPIGSYYTDYFMQIFDAFGELIYEGTNNGWDGTYNGQLSALGNYTYKITVTTASGRKKAVDGNVILVR
jgi:gliding motility-associated-like protein